MINEAKTIMILEDQPLIALDIEDLLLESGFKNISLMSSCLDAKEWLEINHPDLAVLDIRLRDGICIEVAQTLVEREVPFIVHTGIDSSIADENIVFLKGRWLPKPSPSGLFREVVHELLSETASGATV